MAKTNATNAAPSVQDNLNPRTTTHATKSVNPHVGEPASTGASASDRGNDGHSWLSPTGTGVMANGKRIPASEFVPKNNEVPNPMDELGSFRLAQRSPDEGCLFAACVKSSTSDPRYPVGGIVVFDWEKQPKDGDIVCAEALIQDRPDTILQRALTYMKGRSLRAERLLRRWEHKLHQPTRKVYLLRRFVALAEPVPGTPDWVCTEVEETQCNLRLDTLDGMGLSVVHTPLVFVQVIGVATTLRPWGWHRDLVMV